MYIQHSFIWGKKIQKNINNSSTKEKHCQNALQTASKHGLDGRYYEKAMIINSPLEIKLVSKKFNMSFESSDLKLMK